MHTLSALAFEALQPGEAVGWRVGDAVGFEVVGCEVGFIVGLAVG